MSNITILTGRLTSDPHMTAVGETTKAGFNLAIDRSYKKDGKTVTDFPHVVAWGKTAEIVGAYCKKGKPITVQGSIETGDYTKDGKKVYFTEVRADKIFFVPKDTSDSGQQTQSNNQGTGSGLNFN